MRLISDAGQDPAEFHWFDATGVLADKTYVDANPLLECRPPFEKCMVVFQGKTTSGKQMEMFMAVSGNDPDDGIVLSMWLYAAGSKPIARPLMVYSVDKGNIRYNTVDEEEKINDTDATMILGFVSAWYGSMAKNAKSYKPVARNTFTNIRKAKQGKLPTYDWTTIYIEPTALRLESKGGTHAAPRLHDRRGHLRRLKNGKNVWVRSCKVGLANLGSVFHDYAIKETKE